MNKAARRYLSKIGSKGGRSGVGDSKKRGDSEYYRELAKKRKTDPRPPTIHRSESR